MQRGSRGVVCCVALSAFACGGRDWIGDDEGGAGGSANPGSPLNDSNAGGGGGGASAGVSNGGRGGGTSSSGYGMGGARAGSGGSASSSLPAPALQSCGVTPVAGADAGWIAFDSDREDFNRDLFRVRPDGSELQRLTDAPSIDKEPAFSPDGTRLAFTSDREGTPQVYLLELDTLNVTRLTSRAEGADQPSFSHDGTLVAFHSGASVYVIDSTGGTVRSVGTGLDTFNAYFWPHFSLDDTEVLVDRNNEINALPVAGGALRPVVRNWTVTMKSPAVSPDGRDVAYHVFCGRGYNVEALSIWTTPFSTLTDPCGGRRVSPVGEPAATRPTWGPNNRIAYERVDGATNVATIAVISRELGSIPCDVTPTPADHRNPSWWIPPD